MIYIPLVILVMFAMVAIADATKTSGSQSMGYLLFAFAATGVALIYGTILGVLGYFK